MFIAVGVVIGIVRSCNSPFYVLKIPRSLQEIADILRIEPYDALVELDQLVKDGALLREGKMYSYKEVVA